MYAISIAACVSFFSLAWVLGGVQAQLVNPSSPRLQCTNQYFALKGKTCQTIVFNVGLNMTYFQSINPDLNCGAPLPQDTSVCTRAIFPTCSNYQTATTTTCNGLASTWGLTVVKFVAYNDNVNNACDNLVLGNSYCVAINP